MKRILYILVLMNVFPLNICSQDYYWYKGEQIPLQRGNQYYILFDDQLKELDKSQIKESGDVSYVSIPNLMWGITKPNAVLEDTEHVHYQIPSFKDNADSNIFVTHRFYVKLKADDDYATLQELANQYDAEIEKQDEYSPLWYILRWSLKSSYNALELANIFYESGLFAVSEPEIIGSIHLDGPEDVQSTIEQTSAAQKHLRNGILVIELGDKIYNAQGVKIRQK